MTQDPNYTPQFAQVPAAAPQALPQAAPQAPYAPPQAPPQAAPQAPYAQPQAAPQAPYAQPQAAPNPGLAPNPAQYPMSSGMAGGQSLGSMLSTTDMAGERNPPLPLGNHVVEILETGRAERKLALWVKFKILASDSATVGATHGKVFMFGQDGGAQPGQMEMREKSWNSFIYRVLGYNSAEEAAAAGIHPGVVLDACASNLKEIAGRRVAVAVVPSRSGKTDNNGNPYLNENWSVVPPQA